MTASMVPMSDRDRVDQGTARWRLLVDGWMASTAAIDPELVSMVGYGQLRETLSAASVDLAAHYRAAQANERF